MNCVLGIKKLKTPQRLEKAFRHNYRKVEVPNADPEKKHLNEELVALAAKSYYAAYLDIIKGFERQPRKDAVKAIDVLLTYGKGDVTFDEDSWKRENIRWLWDTFGFENVISAVLHKDETTPHIHAIVVPVASGRLNASHFLGGKNAMSDLQTSYASYMAQFGLERGLRNSRARHVDIKRFYAVLNAELAKELPHPEIGESAAAYRDRANEFYVDACLKYMGEKNIAKRDIDALSTKLASALAENKQLKESERISKRIKLQATRFVEILRGLKDGYFPTPEENKAFLVQMQAISDWVQERDRDREAELDER